jgi:DNA-binding PadR family transcriptional regulator
MNIPQLSHLQFAILKSIDNEVTIGAIIRKRLQKRGINQEGPSFYQAMSRLEKAGLLKGRTTQKIIKKQIIRERCYELTQKGRDAVQLSIKFYLH